MNCPINPDCLYVPQGNRVSFTKYDIAQQQQKKTVDLSQKLTADTSRRFFSGNFFSLKKLQRKTIEKVFDIHQF